MSQLCHSLAGGAWTRRAFLASAAALATPALAQAPTKFQLACMTLPYSPFPFDRALQGIKSSGYDYVAWGTTHQRKPVIAVDAPASEGARIATQCRDAGLTPIMMFATVHLEDKTAADAHKRRIDQAAAAGIPFLLTFGGTKPGEYETFIRNLKEIAPAARKANVLVVLKQHGGNSATGKDCARILKEVGDEGLKICYDAGNVLDYESHDPIADIKTCWQDIRAFAIKDHRDTPKDQDCGPGFGEIDHYKLLMPMMRTGLTIPLAFENIFEPLVPRPKTPEGVDALARRAREYVEAVITGLQTLQG